MKFVISPAKTLDFESAALTDMYTQADFLSHSAALMPELRQLDVEAVRGLMGVSEKIADLNVQRFKEWSLPFSPQNAKQAIYAFKGDVYTGIAIETADQAVVDYVQDRVLILSGLYGILRPLDLIMPYRLEMGLKFSNARGKNLYEFWSGLLSGYVNKLMADSGEELVNLASNEYFKALEYRRITSRIVTPVFKDLKNGQYKMISFYAKKARGLMVRYAADHDVSEVEQLKAFDYGGYRFSPELSVGDQWVFTRDSAV